MRFEARDANVALGSHASALDLLSHIGPASRLLAGLDERVRAKALHALGAVLREHERDGEVGIAGGVWVVSARCAASAGVAP